MSEPGLEQLRNTLNAIEVLNEDDWAAFSLLWKPFNAKRKEILSRSGETEKYLYFVTEGVQRIYYEDEEREATLVFTYAPSFGGVLDSLMLQQPSRYYYETLTASSFLRCNSSELMKIIEERKAIERIIRIGITGALSGVLERLAELQSFSSEEKFRKLLERSPHILQLVPHKYLANYIGIDPANFSKLINRVRI